MELASHSKLNWPEVPPSQSILAVRKQFAFVAKQFIHSRARSAEVATDESSKT
jgi:hypothetical protein